MTEEKLLNLLGKYTSGALPEGAELSGMATEKMISLFELKPFTHMGFVWIHSGSFRKWIGQNSGEWVSQRTLATLMRKHGWVAEQGVRQIRVNLWAIPVIKIKELEDARE